MSLFNLKGRQYYFSENFGCDLMFYESEIFFLNPLSVAFLNPKTFTFPFSTKISPTRGVKCEKLNFSNRRTLIR